MGFYVVFKVVVVGRGLDFCPRPFECSGNGLGQYFSTGIPWNPRDPRASLKGFAKFCNDKKKNMEAQ